MEDTSSEVRQIQQRIWMSMPVSDRLRACAEMFETAKAFVRLNMPNGLSDEEEKRFVFEKIYGEPMPNVYRPEPRPVR